MEQNKSGSNQPSPNSSSITVDSSVHLHNVPLTQQNLYRPYEESEKFYKARKIRMIFSGPLQNQNRLHRNILNESKISLLSRCKLHGWVNDFTYTSGFAARTCALACHYIDAYLNTKKDFPVQQLHTLGLVCLIIANKIQDNSQLNIEKDAFEIQNILALQSQICLSLSFDLNPNTYVDMVDGLQVVWLSFVQLVPKVSNSQSPINERLSFKVKTFIHNSKYHCFLLRQLVSFCLYHLQLLDFKLQQVVLTAFYLLFCIGKDLLMQQKLPIDQSIIVRMFTPQSQEKHFIQTFIEYGQSQNYFPNTLQVNKHCAKRLVPLFAAIIKANSKIETIFGVKQSPVVANSYKMTCVLQNKLETYKTYLRQVRQARNRTLSRNTTQHTSN